MENGVLLRNGLPQQERYATHSEPNSDPAADEFHWQRNYLVRPAMARPSYRPSRNNWGPIVVPAGNYFVLGDNRDNSLDSRYWGFVPDSMVRGRPMIVYFSYAPDSTATLDWLSRIRWHRLGETVR
jgi:signal peptidase I